MFKDIPTRSSLWGDAKAQLPDLLHWATEFSEYGVAWREPLPRERKAAHRWESPDYYKYSHFHPAKPSPEHLWTAGVLAGFGVAKLFLADNCGTWLPCALHEAGPRWMRACCKAPASVRASGSACETWTSSVTDVSLSHSFLSTLLAHFSSSGFCREMVCQAPSGAGDDTEWRCLQHFQGFLKQQPSVSWLNCSFIPSWRLLGPLRRGQSP